MKSKIFILLVFSLSILFNACKEDTAEVKIVKPRPHSPWVFRSVLDTQARMITMALDDRLWAAYHVETGGLYKVWDGVVNFEGPVYNQVHGPQPTTLGDAYFVNKYVSPFLLFSHEDTLVTSYKYLGHKFVNDHVVIMHELIYTNQKIHIDETIETSKSENNSLVLNRSFNVDGLADGQKIIFKSNVESISIKENIKTNGEIEFLEVKEVQSENLNFVRADFDLILKNGNTNLDIILMDKAMVKNANSSMNAIVVEEEFPGLQVIANSDCKTCHNKTRKTIGPSYLDIANRYDPSEENKLQLIKKIKQGGSGVWGSNAMTPHPTLSDEGLGEVVDYIFSLRTKKNDVFEGLAVNSILPATNLDHVNLGNGLVTKVFLTNYKVNGMSDIRFNAKPIMAGVMKNFGNIGGSDFVGVNENFAILAQGYFKVDEEGQYDFRIWSDDGSMLYIDDHLIANNDGYHGTDSKKGSVKMQVGYHKIKIEFFQGLGGKFLSLDYKKSTDETYHFFEEDQFFYELNKKKELDGFQLPMATNLKIPGNQNPLLDVHPSFTLTQARPDDFHPMIGGMDFLSDGRLVISVWEPSGAVYILDHVADGDSTKIQVKKIAEGLAEPLGLCVVDDEIYVMQKQEMTHLIDTDGDEIIDEYRTLCDDWQVTANFHEFGFDLCYKDGYFYAALATAILPGGASMPNQAKDRGKVIKVNKETGDIEFVASGLRTPNGVGLGYNQGVFVSDNQGDWLPSSKILEVSNGAFYGSRSVDYQGTAGLKVTPPVVWLPQDEIGNSPSTPMMINVGPYQNQMIHGEVTHGGVKRVFVEEVNGVLQGAVFRFIQGLEAGINRMTWSPDGSLYVGGIGNPGDWGQVGKKWYGLQRLEFNGYITFEILEASIRSNGMELTFTEPLTEGDGWNPKDYLVKQWYYNPTEDYGGPKMDEQELKVLSASVSGDRKKVFLEIEGIKKNHVVYVRTKNFISENLKELRSPELWYTVNEIPKDKNGEILPVPSGANQDNVLTEEEKNKGWKLLFDGKSIDQWRNYKKETIGSSWVINDHAICLNSELKDDGGWQTKDGGDIISKESFENYDLQLDWKIGPCGNSGIMINVQEEDKYDYVWMTGPEMQVLDNSCHPDAVYKKHKAGDLYDLIESKFSTVNPAGSWNHVRIISLNGQVQFWLNGYNVANFDINGEEWKSLIEGSKFKAWPDFGTFTSGHISLQDHGDKVWYKNIKIRKL
ncbi:MAG TPA: DUF1080 domain-containing protein [Saprospiraceae bacterium]|nr:DUF1080 domain-containing protein [Saprospiraceae bacterium]